VPPRTKATVTRAKAIGIRTKTQDNVVKLKKRIRNTVKVNAVIVQKKTVNKAANSPKWDDIIYKRGVLKIRFFEACEFFKAGVYYCK